MFSWSCSIQYIRDFACKPERKYRHNKEAFSDDCCHKIRSEKKKNSTTMEYNVLLVQVARFHGMQCRMPRGDAECISWPGFGSFWDILSIDEFVCSPFLFTWKPGTHRKTLKSHLIPLLTISVHLCSFVPLRMQKSNGNVQIIGSFIYLHLWQIIS